MNNNVCVHLFKLHIVCNSNVLFEKKATIVDSKNYLLIDIVNRSSSIHLFYIIHYINQNFSLHIQYKYLDNILVSWMLS